MLSEAQRGRGTTRSVVAAPAAASIEDEGARAAFAQTPLTAVPSTACGGPSPPLGGGGYQRRTVLAFMAGLAAAPAWAKPDFSAFLESLWPDAQAKGVRRAHVRCRRCRTDARSERAAEGEWQAGRV